MPTSLPSGDVRYELNDGKLVITAPPCDVHGHRQAKIVQYLGVLGEDRGHGETRADVGIILHRDPDRVVAADAAFNLKESLPVRRSPEGYLETIPELVVEIRSKNDTQQEINSKNEEYFDAGVKVIWVIDPDTRTIIESRRGMPNRSFSNAETLTCDLIPNFAVPIASLFAGS